MAKYNMNIDWIIANNTAKLKVSINRALNKLKSTAKDLSPVDTWKFIYAHKTIEAKTIGKWKVVWKIRNDTPYARYIEFGRIFLWKTNNYHKNKKVIYTWLWNRTYQRAWVKEKANIRTIIINTLWQ